MCLRHLLVIMSLSYKHTIVKILILRIMYLLIGFFYFSIFRDHDLRIIRPFIYVREKAIRQFVTTQNLPAMLNSAICPEISKQRQRARQLLAQHEILFPKLFTSLRNALHPLIGFHIDDNDDVDHLLHHNNQGDIIKSRKKLKSINNNNTDGSSDPETDEEPILKQ